LRPIARPSRRRGRSASSATALSGGAGRYVAEMDGEQISEVCLRASGIWPGWLSRDLRRDGWG
jgi:hypothetical protein